MYYLEKQYEKMAAEKAKKAKEELARARAKEGWVTIGRGASAALGEEEEVEEEEEEEVEEPRPGPRAQVPPNKPLWSQVVPRDPSPLASGPPGPPVGAPPPVSGEIRLTEEQQRKAKQNQDLLRQERDRAEQESLLRYRAFDDARQADITLDQNRGALKHAAQMNVTEEELEDFIRDVVAGMDLRYVTITGSNFSIRLRDAVDQFAGGLPIRISSRSTYKCIAGTFTVKSVKINHAY